MQIFGKRLRQLLSLVLVCASSAQAFPVKMEKVTDDFTCEEADFGSRYDLTRQCQSTGKELFGFRMQSCSKAEVESKKYKAIFVGRCESLDDALVINNRCIEAAQDYARKRQIPFSGALVDIQSEVCIVRSNNGENGVCADTYEVNTGTWNVLYLGSDTDCWRPLSMAHSNKF